MQARNTVLMSVLALMVNAWLIQTGVVASCNQLSTCIFHMVHSTMSLERLFRGWKRTAVKHTIHWFKVPKCLFKLSSTLLKVSELAGTHRKVIFPFLFPLFAIKKNWWPYFIMMRTNAAPYPRSPTLPSTLLRVMCNVVSSVSWSTIRLAPPFALCHPRARKVEILQKW